MAEFVVEFEAIDNAFGTEFEGFTPVSDGGFERGYQDGYADALSNRTDLVVTENGEYAPSEGSTGFKSVSVNVAGKVAKVVDGTITELTEADLQGATAIIRYAFYFNSSLKKIDIPNGVTKIDSSAFYKCSNLTTIKLPKSLLRIESSAFYECTNLSSVVLEDNSELTYIGMSAFYKCSNLTNITIPRSVKYLESDVFSSCSALTSVDISEDSAMTTIGSQAFYQCSNLTNITIPSLVKIIGSGTFYNCSALKRIVLKRATPPSIQSTTFRNIPADCVFVVPYGYGERYKSSTNWSAYADQIIEGDE